MQIDTLEEEKNTTSKDAATECCRIMCTQACRRTFIKLYPAAKYALHLIHNNKKNDKFLPLHFSLIETKFAFAAGAALRGHPLPLLHMQQREPLQTNINKHSRNVIAQRNPKITLLKIKQK